MQEPYRKGVANQPDPESCAVVRETTSADVTSTALGAVTTTEVTNTFGEAGGYTASASGATLFDEQVTLRDPMGRIVDKTETVQGVMHAHHYAYDGAGRLTDVTIDGVPSAHYDYDENGNRLARITASGSETGSYDQADQAETYDGLNYDYTARGNLASVVNGSASTDYDYDAFGNLRQVTLEDGRVIDYDIDPQHRRVGKRVNGVRTYGLLYSDALRPVVQLDATNTVVALFVYATRSNAPDYMVAADGQTYRFVLDHLGSVRLVVNTSDGTVAQRLDYDEFGRVLLDTNPGFQPFGFAGGLYDADTGLVRFGARDYDAVTGRWTAKDPILFGGGQPNLYAYSFNDPVNFIDRTGRNPFQSEWQLRQALQQAFAEFQRMTGDSPTQRAYRDAYNEWWNSRPPAMENWGPVSNWANMAGIDEAPVCADYAEAAAEYMNEQVDIPGTGAYPVYSNEEPTGTLGDFTRTDGEPWHTNVQVYDTAPNGEPRQVDEYDPWWQVW